MKTILHQWTAQLIQSMRIHREPAGARYIYSPAHGVVNDFAEFARMPISVIERNINGFQTLTKRDWRQLPGSTFEERARQFYAASNHYIFDLLAVNADKSLVIRKLNRFSPGLLDTIRRHPGRRFLEFGGGTGVFCQIVAEMGKHVTYLDIPGPVFDFALWRLQKHGVPVDVICAEPGRPTLDREFDVIFSDAVIEHLPPREQEQVVDVLSAHLAPGGVLFLLVDLAGESEDMPMHADVDIARLHRIMMSRGLQAISGINQFCSTWVRPASQSAAASLVGGAPNVGVPLATSAG